jgi:uncharacterized protein (DUF58 family)
LASLLKKVKSKMTIYAHQKVRGLLDGEYGSVFKGRSMDFDDLREYILGDDVKDIDWKATARSGQTLIRRYVAIRKHNIMLVVNTGKSMKAVTPTLEDKTDVSIMIAGVMGYLAQKHGDLVSLVAGDDAGAHFIPLSGRNAQLEQMLQYVDKRANAQSANSNANRIFEYIARNIKRKMILIVISDSIEVDDVQLTLLRRLRAQHEIMFVRINDFDPANPEHLSSEVFDVQDPVLMPYFIRSHKTLFSETQRKYQERNQRNLKSLQRLGISSVDVSSEREVIPKLFLLLEKQRHAK